MTLCMVKTHWMLYNYPTHIKVSTPGSFQYHITRDTLLKLVVVQVLLFTTLHGFPVYRLYSKRCMVVLGWFWPELFIKLVVSPQLITIHHPWTSSNSKGSLILKGAFTVRSRNIFIIIRCCDKTMASTDSTSHASFSTYWAVTYEDGGFFNLEIISASARFYWLFWRNLSHVWFQQFTREDQLLWALCWDHKSHISGGASIREEAATTMPSVI